MVRIESIRRSSAAALAGLQADDRITHVNDQEVRDVLDFHFHSSGEEELALRVIRGVEATEVTMFRHPGQDLGLTLVPDKIRLCGNECVFCFIDQNPSGLRPSLYVKDEDYRLSFLHGNFVTLTNMKEWEIRRVVEQRLTPIYLSVHSMNPETRKRLLRSRKERDIRPILDYFRNQEITMHTQIVLCPGFNDGADLEETIASLAAYYPAVQSLAIVPLGMTDHRDGLIPLTRITPEYAAEVVAGVEEHQERFRRRWGITFLYLADEWYRLLGRVVPPFSHYDGFPQLDNGIGMTRNFLHRLARQKRVFPRPDGRVLQRVTVVTGALFRPILEEALQRRLQRTGEETEVNLVGVRNDFFGSAVTVAGLLAGGDILRTLTDQSLGDRVFLPPSVLNDDERFLDDLTRVEVERRLGVPVQAGFRDRWW